MKTKIVKILTDKWFPDESDLKMLEAKADKHVLTKKSLCRAFKAIKDSLENQEPNPSLPMKNPKKFRARKGKGRR